MTRYFGYGKRCRRTAAVVSVLALAASARTGTAAAALPADQVEFFEKQIRPVLVERCYECHNSTSKKKGGLALDWKGATLAGGERGPAVVPGKPGESLLIRAIRHADSKLKMPQAGPKLADPVVQAFERWIAMGAPDPRDHAPSAQELASSTSWEAIRDRRMKWWSFQPLHKDPAPEVRDAAWATSAIDRYILAKLEAAGLRPAPEAGRATLLRRVTLTLTGLPPTPSELDDFLKDPSADAYEKVVDRLLASPRFGECWARHWMDWVRYTESHGSEGDPPIPYAWRYRDYLIRALNKDVPYDRLVREHIAGDLLPDPRIDTDSGVNESAIATAHYRMVQHGYAPTDALEEQITFTDNQIDVISKGFLGLTVSCARCHNHKFDPISQTDFYAMYGIMASSRPGLLTIDPPARDAQTRRKMVEIKNEIRAKLALAWLKAADELPDRLLAAPAPAEKKPPARPAIVSGWQGAIDEAASQGERSPLHAWLKLRDLQVQAFKANWESVVARPPQPEATHYKLRWDLSGADNARWLLHGTGFAADAPHAGEFSLAVSGPSVIENIYRAGVYSHLLSQKDSAVLQSPRFKIETDEIWVWMAGEGGAKFRLVVYNYPRADGPIYPAVAPSGRDGRWYSIDTRYWKGEWAYLEFATAADLPIGPQMPPGKSWFGSIEVVGRDQSQPAPAEKNWSWPTGQVSPSPADAHGLAERYGAVVRDAVTAWRDGKATDDQAELLSFFVQRNLLPNARDLIPALGQQMDEYRRLEASLPTPTRSPSVFESAGFDQPLFVRGDHKQQSAAVPRRFIEAMEPKPYQCSGSGRLQLAESILSPLNPLTARVITNRLWKHVFGDGIVATVDNFGQLGDLPTHPELLDHLAGKMVEDGWSLKRAIRRMVTSRTYRMSSDIPPEALERDPQNRLLSHMGVHRLEAEAIRDNLLAMGGGIDAQMYGPPAEDGSKRRSIYLAVQRNHLNPFLASFDAPPPFTTVGRRDVTNVPAQSLALLNDSFVIEQAGRWADAVMKDSSLAGIDARVDAMFVSAFARKPGSQEREQVRQYLGANHADEKTVMQDAHAWRDLAHAMFNMKEFIYVR